MEVSETVPDYTEMSLDDVIRDMRARKQMQDDSMQGDGVSPLFRKGQQQLPRQRLRNRNLYPPISEYSNYIRAMARKKIGMAKQTLDLRRKLISQRTSKGGLDLRWKLIALLVSKLRAKYGGQRRRFRPYPSLYPSSLSGGSCIQSNGFKMMDHRFISRPKVEPTYVNQLEQLVGKLPAWMTKPRVAAPPPPPKMADVLDHNEQMGLDYYGTSSYDDGRHFGIEDYDCGPPPLVDAPPVVRAPSSARSLINRPILSCDVQGLTFGSRAIPFSHSAIRERAPLDLTGLDLHKQPLPQVAPVSAPLAPAPLIPFGIRSLRKSPASRVKNPSAAVLRQSLLDIGHPKPPTVQIRDSDLELERLPGGIPDDLDRIVIEVENGGVSPQRSLLLNDRFTYSS